MKVLFSPSGILAEGREGESILSLAQRYGIYIPASCGGVGFCSKCKVKIDGKVKLACQTRVMNNMRVYLEDNITRQDNLLVVVPDESYSFDDPIGKKIFLNIEKPTLSDNRGDSERFINVLKQKMKIKEEPQIHFDVLKKLPDVLRAGNFSITASILDTRRKEVVDISPFDTTNNSYCLAVDIGTTTIGIELIPLFNTHTKKTVRGQCFNRQIIYGEDVITRCIYSEKEEGLLILQKEVLRSIEDLTKRLCQSISIKPSDVFYMVVVGNTTMLQIFLGISPKYIRLEPYTPTLSDSVVVKAKTLGFDELGEAYVVTLPPVASYIGADTVAGVLAADILKDERIKLYIDIGTNGELVLGNSEYLVSCSCSAGPALEGGNIKHGMPAEEGAISRVILNKDKEPMIVTIGNKRPCGICGSGVINTVAELFLSKELDNRGKFINPQKKEFVLVKRPISKYKIAITEEDIGSIIRAKAAVYAGISVLIKKLGMGIKDLDEIIIAGNFGDNIDLNSAKIIGMLPDIDSGKYRYIGNAALRGACQVATSKKIFKLVKKIKEKITNIELSTDPDFYNEFTAALFLPHTDTSLFPILSSHLKKGS